MEPFLHTTQALPSIARRELLVPSALLSILISTRFLVTKQLFTTQGLVWDAEHLPAKKNDKLTKRSRQFLSFNQKRLQNVVGDRARLGTQQVKVFLPPGACGCFKFQAVYSVLHAESPG
jgi:hypothetical protein